MFKHVLSALVVSSVMAGGAAFAADQTGTTSQVQETAPVKADLGKTGQVKADSAKGSQVSDATKTTHEKKHVKPVKVKASTTKSETTAPAKTTN